MSRKSKGIDEPENAKLGSALGGSIWSSIGFKIRFAVINKATDHIFMRVRIIVHYSCNLWGKGSLNL